MRPEREVFVTFADEKIKEAFENMFPAIINFSVGAVVPMPILRETDLYVKE